MPWGCVTIATKDRYSRRAAAQRRFDPTQFSNGERGRSAEQAAQAYLELAQAHFLRLEQDASEALSELEAALDDLARVAGGARDSQGIEEFGEKLIDHNRLVAERTAHLRRRVERRGGLEPVTLSDPRSADPEPAKRAPRRRKDRRPAGPSEGVRLLTRHMVASGYTDRRIIKVLTSMGVADPDAAFKAALH